MGGSNRKFRIFIGIYFQKFLLLYFFILDNILFVLIFCIRFFILVIMFFVLIFYKIIYFLKIRIWLQLFFYIFNRFLIVVLNLVSFIYLFIDERLLVFIGQDVFGVFFQRFIYQVGEKKVVDLLFYLSNRSKRNDYGYEVLIIEIIRNYRFLEIG